MNRVTMCSGKKKRKTQIVPRTQSKPNFLEGHNVFWGFIPLFFTYTVLLPAKGFVFYIAKYHGGGGEVGGKSLPWIYFQTKRKMNALERQAVTLAATFQRSFRAVIWAYSFICYFKQKRLPSVLGSAGPTIIQPKKMCGIYQLIFPERIFSPAESTNNMVMELIHTHFVSRKRFLSTQDTVCLILYLFLKKKYMENKLLGYF